MIKLNDIQSLLLSNASRQQGSVNPLPAGISSAAAAEKAITALLKRGLVEERETSAGRTTRRTEGYINLGVFVTAAGLAAIGLDEDGAEGDDLPPAASPAPATSKKATVIALLSAGAGATMAELIAATGWLPHTTRAALTGLRKAGYDIERSKRDGDTCYRITASA